MNIRPTEYMYSSARVRAMENGIMGASRLRGLADSKNTAEAVEKLSSFGVNIKRDDVNTDAALVGKLSAAYAEICQSAPSEKIFEWLKYPYDCNNLKLAIKCRIRGTRADELLFDFGSVSAAATIDSAASGDYSAFPKNMAAAADEAVQEYAKTHDPQRIDSIIDKACYADMLECAVASGEDVFVDWVKTKIDLTNVMMTLRLIRMKRGEYGEIFLRSALLSGGDIDAEALALAYRGGVDELTSLVYKSRYSKFAEAMVKTDKSLSAIEKCSDDYFMSRVKEVKWLPFGAPVLAAYLVAVEYEVKNIRIILAAKDAGLSGDVIFERLRESYV